MSFFIFAGISESGFCKTCPITHGRGGDTRGGETRGRGWGNIMKTSRKLRGTLLESSDSRVKFRHASNRCKRILEAAKLTYANKTKESITSQKLGSRDFW